jgi:immunity protein, SdpI family
MRSIRSPHTFLIVAGYGLGVALYAGLPDQIPPTLSVSGRSTVWLGGPMVAFLLPTAAAITDALLRGLCVRHPIDEPDSTSILAVYDAVMLRFILLVMGVHAMVLAGLRGMLWGHEWTAQVVPVMLGLTMIGIGNLLPRTRPNLAIGIRTRRTLSDRALWIRMHRFAGSLLVALGCVIVLAAFAVPAPIGTGMILLVGPAAMFGIFLRMLYFRRRAHA